MNTLKLSDFLRKDINPILDAWERFAGALPSAKRMNPAALRDHARGMLETIAADLDHSQSAQEQIEKSQGRAPHANHETEAELHGAGRGAAGFSVMEGLSEFRALRASVMRLWAQSNPDAPPHIDEDLVRFNEAIDQALAESIARYSSDKETTTRLFDTLLSSSQDLNFILDANGNFIYANRAMADLYGIALCDLPSRNIAAIDGPIADVQQKLHKVVDTRRAIRGEMPHELPDGAELTYEYLLAPVVNPQGNVEAIAGMVRDITEHKAHEENIRRSANFDALTGLPNRNVFRDRLEQEAKRSDRTGLPMALLFIDLDGFKGVNDRFGHDAGDALLQQAALRVVACVRGTDTVARMGGDEFTVILAEINNLRHIEIVAQKIVEELARPFTIAGRDVSITGSIGITVYPHDSATHADLLGNADQAMYEAKHAGGNRFSFYCADLRDAAWTRLKAIEDLRNALPGGELRVHYQPIVDLSSGTILKAEALLRWKHPQAGLMLPESFVALAEEAGLIGAIDEWVLGEAVSRAREWSELLGTAFEIGVNNSATEFVGREPMKRWDAHVARSGPAANGISVEMSEGALENASPMVVEKLKALHDAGIRLAIDRFGTGCSSMARLKEFGVDYLKMDKSLVHGALASADRRTVAEAAIVMAHMLGLKVIAEGVESVEQRDWLRAAGCDYAQGYYFSDAVPPRDFANLLRRNRHPPLSQAMHS